MSFIFPVLPPNLRKRGNGPTSTTKNNGHKKTLIQKDKKPREGRHFIKGKSIQEVFFENIEYLSLRIYPGFPVDSILLAIVTS